MGKEAMRYCWSRTPLLFIFPLWTFIFTATVSAQEASLEFSHDEGIFPGSIALEMTSNSDAGTIYYTLDCSVPDHTSTPYTGPVHISENTVVRARVFIGDSAVTSVKAGTFIIGETTTLPLALLVSEPGNLWDDDIGIFTHKFERGREWERPAQLSFVENGQLRFNVPAGIRVHGESSRYYDKHNLRIYFRSEYGLSRLRYHLFEQKSIDEFNRLVLYAPASDHSAGHRFFTLIQDAFNHSILASIGGITSAFRPVTLYLNSEYWGVYWFREYMDLDFLSSNFGIDDADMLRALWRGPEAREGDLVFWNETLHYFRNADTEDSAMYQHIRENYIHLDNFTDYHIINIFAANRDWPEYNSDWFHDRESDDTRWRWLMWDTNYSWRFEPDHPTLEWATRDEVRTDIREIDDEYGLWITLILRKLLENRVYRSKFVNRFADLMNTVLRSDSLIQRYDSIADMIAPEMKKEVRRWPGDTDRTWGQNLADSRSFMRDRPACMRQQIIHTIDLAPPPVKITVEASSGEGRVRISTIMVPETYPWEGYYYKNIPVPVEAIPKPGYIFSHWSDSSFPSSIRFDLVIPTEPWVGDRSFHAVFREDTSRYSQTDIVINEINYNSYSGFNPDDWIEIFFNGPVTVNLSGWKFRDSNSTETFYLPDGLILDSGSYLVLCRDTAAFHSCFPDVERIAGNFPFGLNSAGEQIRLLDQSGQVIDSVTYDNRPPWPVQPDGRGVTLELKAPELDNSLASSWQASMGHGTPGAANSIEVERVIKNDSLAVNEINYNAHPDFDPEDWIELANYSGRPLDISGWILQDNADDHFFVIPDGIMIAPDSLLVICRDTTAFRVCFPDVGTFSGEMNFGLARTGDMVRISTEWGMLIDSVNYGNTAPWPSGPDGGGSTLELKSPYFNNSLPENWHESIGHGTPGRTNSAGVSGIGNENTDSPQGFELNRNFPNPFNTETVIRFTLPERGLVKVDILDLRGKIVNRLMNKLQNPGAYTIIWSGTDRRGRSCPSGIYFCRVVAGRFHRTIRMVLLK
jgi:hypothetical protein